MERSVLHRRKTKSMIGVWIALLLAMMLIIPLSSMVGGASAGGNDGNTHVVRGETLNYQADAGEKIKSTASAEYGEIPDGTVNDTCSKHIVINEVCYNELDYDASWIELYNPTSESINMTDWTLWFYYLNGPVRLSLLSNGKPIMIGPKEYLILCGKEDHFKRWWDVPEGTKIIEQAIGPNNDSIQLDNESLAVVDSVYWGEGGQLPPLPANHSWARYRGGYDTDNFTDDFYDEPNPTPGYENNLGKNDSSADYLVINEVYYGDNDSTWWIEIYNPTNRIFNLTALTYLNIDCLSVLPPDDPKVLFYPHEYVLFCGSVEKFTSSWNIPSGVKIIKMDYFGRNTVMIITSDDATNESASGKYCDIMGDGLGDEYYPLPHLHHSWARYRGGYDTDNFTNDFYDEPSPTPGYENNLGKNPTNPSPPANLTATLSDSKVNLTWDPPLNDGNATITEYRIYRGTSPDSLEIIASVNSSVSEYMDSNVSEGVAYYYSVSAVNQLGESNLSEVVSIEIPGEKPRQTPSLDFVWIIGAIALAYVTFHRKKRPEK